MRLEHLCVASSLLLAGCLSTGGAYKVDVEDYGPPPTRAESTVREYYQRVLRNPAGISNQYVSAAEKVWLGSTLGRPGHGYVVCTTFDYVASEGASAIAMKDGIVIRDDTVVQRLEACEWNWKYLCSRTKPEERMKEVDLCKPLP